MPQRHRLGDTPHNYVVEHQNELGNLFRPIVSEGAGGGGPNMSPDLFFFKRGETVLNLPLEQQHCKI